MTHPDPEADFVEQVLAAAHRLLSGADAPLDVTDVQIADATGLELVTVRTVLEEENDRRVTMSRAEHEDGWRVARAELPNP